MAVGLDKITVDSLLNNLVYFGIIYDLLKKINFSNFWQKCKNFDVSNFSLNFSYKLVLLKNLLIE